MQACGGGRYEFTVTSGQAGAVDVSASASQGPHLWASSAVGVAGRDGGVGVVSQRGPNTIHESTGAAKRSAACHATFSMQPLF